MAAKYTDHDINFLLNNYPHQGAEYCSKFIDHSINSIKAKCHKLNIKLLRSTRCKLAEQSKNKNPEDFAVNVNLFLNINNPEIAYILGLIWGDGDVYKKYRISLGCVKTDADYFYTIFLKTGKWKYYLKCDQKYKDRMVIHTSNKYIVNFLTENDYKSKSLMSACKILSKIPERLQRYFYIGLSDADGSFYYHRKTKKTNQYTIYGSYNQDWGFLEKLYSKLDIPYSINRIIHKKSKSSMIRITGYKNIKKIGEYLYSSYHNDKIGLPRKYQIYSEIVNRNKHV